MSEITDLLDKAEEGAFVYIPERICKILRLLDAKVEALEERWPQAIGELSIWKHMDERVSALDNKMDSLLKLDPYRISGISKPTLAPPEPPPKQEREPAGHAVWAPPAKGSSNYPLFEHMSRAHGLTLLESELDEIIRIVHEMAGGPKREPAPAPTEQRLPEPGSGTAARMQPLEEIIGHVKELIRAISGKPLDSNWRNDFDIQARGILGLLQRLPQPIAAAPPQPEPVAATEAGDPTPGEWSVIKVAIASLSRLTRSRLARELDTEAAAELERLRNRQPCPCMHTTPCDPWCTCVHPTSSRGCDRCCSHGSKEQQQAKAEAIVRSETELERLRDLTRWHDSEKEKPPMNKTVIVDGGVAIWTGEHWEDMTGRDWGRHIAWEVTHWLPLPLVPKEEK